jgi:hypothetical protein
MSYISVVFLKPSLQATASLPNIRLMASVANYVINSTFFELLGGVVHFWF